MYSIKLDENKYFTGSYAKVGKVHGGINIPTLPPTEDYNKSLCYKYDYYDVQVSTERIPVIDEDTGEHKTDENGELLYIDTPIYKTVLGWIYDEIKYNKFIEDEANKVVEPTQEEIINQLKADNELLKGCVMELANIVLA